ncbi:MULTISPECIES: hypothetical protein [unclassified Roseitalea]|uniref:hypothetical protein n=1 Tax=unclassified Roseitalea TaxID=2639107 RepID=UPI00273E7242|nr:MULTISPECIES: hypothetical protein [unclassified Roseitalea]
MKKLFARFLADRRGGAYIMAAFAVVPMFGMVSLAVDYTNYTRNESVVDTAAQSVALHIAKRIALNPNLKAEDLVEEGKSLLGAMTPGLDIIYDTFHVDPATGLVQIETAIEFDTYFMQLFGHETLIARTETQAQFGRRNVEVAIAMDNSGSMSQWAGSKRKIDAAKDAAEILIDSASASLSGFENADLKFSVIPWHTNVSVPESARTDAFGNDAWWIDWEGRSTGHFTYLAPYLDDGGASDGDMYFRMPDAWGNMDDEWDHYDPARLVDHLPLEPDGNGVDIDALRALPDIGIVTRKDVFDLFHNVEWNGCFEHRHGKYRYSFEPPNNEDGDSLFVPHMAPDEADWWGSRNSYVYDLGGETDYPYNAFEYGDWQVRSRARVANTPKYVISKTWMDGDYDDNWSTEGPNGKCNTSPLIPLTDDRDDILDAIDDMQANGNTDLTIGLEWAMHTLTPWEPLAQGGDFAETQKILVFMTDGDNFPRNPGHYATSYTSFQYPKDDLLDLGLPNQPSQSQGTQMFDGASKKYCTEIKNMGVRIYFVYFGNPSSAATEIMNHCASSPATAIAASDADELEEAFEMIGNDIGKLRLSHYTPLEDG